MILQSHSKLLLLALIFGIYWFFTPFAHPLLSFLFSLVFTYVVIHVGFFYIQWLLIKVYKRRHRYDHIHKDNVTLSIQRMTFIISHALFFIVFLYLLGIEIKELLTSMSIFAVALVLIFKEHIANFLAGIVIMLSTDFRINNYVRIGEYKGRIKDIDFINTTLETPQGEEVFIPNTTVYSKEVVNYSSIKTKILSLEFSAKKPFDMQALEQLLQVTLAEQFAHHLQAKDISVHITFIKDELIEYVCELTIYHYHFEVEQKIKRFAYNIIVNHLKQ
ncbi:MAG: mechanosensitive ion channel family protein [Candidatus Woesearchaeota archaeon]